MNSTLEKKNKKLYTDFSLSSVDVKFLSGKMGIPISSAVSLFEEKQDLDLVIYELSANKKILLKEIVDLSLYAYVKFLIFHYTKKCNFTFEEKNYVADLVFHGFPKVKNEEVQVSIKVKKEAEKMAGYCLVIISFFGNVLDKFENDKNEIAKLFLDFIVDSFNNINKDFISDNLEEWILILKKMKTKLDKKV